jgi:hypothetical protein
MTISLNVLGRSKMSSAASCGKWVSIQPRGTWHQMPWKFSTAVDLAQEFLRSKQRRACVPASTSHRDYGALKSDIGRVASNGCVVLCELCGKDTFPASGFPVMYQFADLSFRAVRGTEAEGRQTDISRFDSVRSFASLWMTTLRVAGRTPVAKLIHQRVSC